MKLLVHDALPSVWWCLLGVVWLKKKKKILKILAPGSVDYIELPSHDVWKETLLLSFSDVYFQWFEHHKSAILFQYA